MRPYFCAIMGGANAWQASSVPVRLVSRMSLHSCRLTCSVGVRLVRPAQIHQYFHSAESRDHGVTQLCQAARVGHIANHCQRTLFAASNFFPQLQQPDSRACRWNTLAPASANPLVSASPMPDVPPITTAVFRLSPVVDVP